MRLSLKLLALFYFLSKVSAAATVALHQGLDQNANTENQFALLSGNLNTEDAFLRNLFDSSVPAEIAYYNASNYAFKSLLTCSPESLHLIGNLLLKVDQYFVAGLCLERFIEICTLSTNPTHVLKTAMFFHKHNPIMAAKGYQKVLDNTGSSNAQLQDARQGLDKLKTSTE